jgi:2,4-dienoyl-CoA reductase-like NADH-dependent reductase (Old Yellow Enzyme family)
VAALEVLSDPYDLGGRRAAGQYPRTAAWAPSGDPWKLGAQVPHVMSAADIRTVVRGFAQAGAWMIEAGFDGIEVHLGHGRLIQQFLSPAVDHRSGGYGGSEQGRLRLAREVLEVVRGAVPAAVPVGIRISADEFLPGGLVVDQMIDIVGRLRDEFDLATRGGRAVGRGPARRRPPGRGPDRRRRVRPAQRSGGGVRGQALRHRDRPDPRPPVDECGVVGLRFRWNAVPTWRGWGG